MSNHDTTSLPNLPADPEAPKDFIIRNNSAGPLCINDMHITLEPFQALDLTWEDPRVVRGSKHLARQLTIGSASRITREEYDTIQNSELYGEMSNMNIDPRSLARNGSEAEAAGGRVFRDADEFDLRFSNSESERKQYLNEIRNAGLTTDPLLYAMACKQAQESARAAGRPFDAKVFSEQWQKKDRASIRRLASTLSTAQQPKSYVAGQAPDNQVYAYESKGGNLNRDGYLNGGPDGLNFVQPYQPVLIPDALDVNSGYAGGFGNPYGDNNNQSFAEEIDLASSASRGSSGGDDMDDYSGINHAPIKRVQ